MFRASLRAIAKPKVTTAAAAAAAAAALHQNLLCTKPLQELSFAQRMPTPLCLPSCLKNPQAIVVKSGAKPAFYNIYNLWTVSMLVLVAFCLASAIFLCRVTVAIRINLRATSASY